MDYLKHQQKIAFNVPDAAGQPVAVVSNSLQFTADFFTMGLFTGLQVVARPYLLKHSTDIVLLKTEPRWQPWHVVPLESTVVVVVYSTNALAQMLNGVQWHDYADHCRTWNGACCCDLGPEA